MKSVQHLWGRDGKRCAFFAGLGKTVWRYYRLSRKPEGGSGKYHRVAMQCTTTALASGLANRVGCTGIGVTRNPFQPLRPCWLASNSILVICGRTNYLWPNAERNVAARLAGRKSGLKRRRCCIYRMPCNLVFLSIPRPLDKEGGEPYGSTPAADDCALLDVLCQRFHRH